MQWDLRPLPPKATKGRRHKMCIVSHPAHISWKPTHSEPLIKTQQLSHVWSIQLIEKISSKVWCHVWSDSEAQMCAENQLQDNGSIVSTITNMILLYTYRPHLMKKLNQIIIARHLGKNWAGILNNFRFFFSCFMQNKFYSKPILHFSSQI